MKHKTFGVQHVDFFAKKRRVESICQINDVSVCHMTDLDRRLSVLSITETASRENVVARF